MFFLENVALNLPCISSQCFCALVHILVEVAKCGTVKSHFKALGLYNFKKGFGWSYKPGGELISGWAYKRNKKMFRNDEIKHI